MVTKFALFSLAILSSSVEVHTYQPPAKLVWSVSSAKARSLPGVRRIEAITGAKVEELMDAVQDTLNDLKALFNNAPDLKVAIRKYIDENAGLKKQVDEFMKEKAAEVKARLVANAKEVNGVKVVKAVIPMSADVVKDIAFQLKGEIPANLFVVIGSVDNNKPMLTVMISDDLVKAGQNAGKLVREAAKLIQGGGGGQPHFATAGGKMPMA